MPSPTPEQAQAPTQVLQPGAVARYEVMIMHNTADLAAVVTEKMADGWRCQGGVQCFKDIDTDKWCYLQAVVR